MLYNFFLIALRNIKKQRGYSVVNVGGLAVGIASVLFILLYTVDELTYDTMHPQAENTYRIGYWEQTEDGEINQYPLAPAGWDNYLNDNYESVTAKSSFSTSRIIAVAVCIGLPIAYAVSNWWLSNFAYQTSLGVEVFGLSVLAISLLTVLTVGYETLKAAMVNPVKALKHD